MKRIAATLGVIFAFHAFSVWAQGIAVRSSKPTTTTANERLTINVPVQVQNFPLNHPEVGAEPLRVTCKIMDYRTPILPVASATVPVPFTPAPGNVNYQGSVIVTVDVPHGTYKPIWQCFLDVPTFHPPAPVVNTGSSVLTTEAAVAPL
jgi:hypothetical protein